MTDGPKDAYHFTSPLRVDVTTAKWRPA